MRTGESRLRVQFRSSDSRDAALLRFGPGGWTCGNAKWFFRWLIVVIGCISESLHLPVVVESLMVDKSFARWDIFATLHLTLLFAVWRMHILDSAVNQAKQLRHRVMLSCLGARMGCVEDSSALLRHSNSSRGLVLGACKRQSMRH